MHRVLQGEPVRDVETIVRTRGGRERVVLWNVTRLLSAAGVPIRIIACGQDITARKRAEQEMQRADRLALRERELPTVEADTIVQQSDRIT